MQVEVLRSTETPERLVCQAARGDYYDGYVGDTEYAELMRDVDVPDHIVREVLPKWTGVEIEDDERVNFNEEAYDYEGIVECRTRAFIEKQLSRGHYGPWEHPQITFAVSGVSRVTMAQITRHRLMSFDVQSMRYVDFSEVDAITPKSLTDPEHFSRETGMVGDINREVLRGRYEEIVSDALDYYETMVDEGVPKEDARFVLPLGTPVNMTFSGNARTFLHLMDMRKKANAQWEVRELSEALIEELQDWMPYTFAYYEEHGPNKLAP